MDSFHILIFSKKKKSQMTLCWCHDAQSYKFALNFFLPLSFSFGAITTSLADQLWRNLFFFFSLSFFFSNMINFGGTIFFLFFPFLFFFSDATNFSEKLCTSCGRKRGDWSMSEEKKSKSERDICEWGKEERARARTRWLYCVPKLF